MYDELISSGVLELHFGGVRLLEWVAIQGRLTWVHSCSVGSVPPPNPSYLPPNCTIGVISAALHPTTLHCYDSSFPLTSDMSNKTFYWFVTVALWSGGPKATYVTYGTEDRNNPLLFTLYVIIEVECELTPQSWNTFPHQAICWAITTPPSSHTHSTHATHSTTH